MNASLALILEEEAKRQSRGSGGGKPKIQISTEKSKSSIADYRSRNKGQTYRAGRKGKVWGQRPGRTVSTHGGLYRVVSKSKYVVNGSKAKTILKQALDYYQNRERADFEDERKYFTKDRDGLDRLDIKDEIESKFGDKIAYHTMILSSGDNSVDVKRFARDVMQEWEERLGYEIDYWAVAHYNTDHYHTHLIIAGRSEGADRDVRFDRAALNEMREIGNDYLARERMLDRELDRQVEKELLRGIREYDLSVEREFKGEMQPLSKQELTELGLSSNYRIREEMRDLGLGNIYELGKPFEAFEKIESHDRDLISSLIEERDDISDNPSDINENALWDREVIEDAFELSMQDLDYDEVERVSMEHDRENDDVDVSDKHSRREDVEEKNNREKEDDY